jgi:hypothetical protein
MNRLHTPGFANGITVHAPERDAPSDRDHGL